MENIKRTREYKIMHISGGVFSHIQYAHRNPKYIVDLDTSVDDDLDNLGIVNLVELIEETIETYCESLNPKQLQGLFDYFQSEGKRHGNII
jgi:hypothetical protein